MWQRDIRSSREGILGCRPKVSWFRVHSIVDSIVDSLVRVRRRFLLHRMSWPSLVGIPGVIEGFSSCDTRRIPAESSCPFIVTCDTLLLFTKTSHKPHLLLLWGDLLLTKNKRVGQSLGATLTVTVLSSLEDFFETLLRKCLQRIYERRCMKGKRKKNCHEREWQMCKNVQNTLPILFVSVSLFFFLDTQFSLSIHVKSYPHTILESQTIRRRSGRKTVSSDSRKKVRKLSVKQQVSWEASILHSLYCPKGLDSLDSDDCCCLTLTLLSASLGDLFTPRYF